MSDFRLGDIVETIKGAKFWGEIIAIDNDGNSPGCTVLAVDPGFAGTKHVYPLKQLAHRAPSPSPAPGVVEELLSDLATRPIIDGINYRALIRDFQERALRALSQPAKGELPDRDTSKPAEQQGLFRKFEVRRTDGSDQPGGKHHGCRYFVIDIDHDQYATDALTAYADACARTHPELARDLREKWGAASPANPAQGVREALSDCLDMLARFTHSTSNDLNHVEARAVYRAGRAALAAIDTAPKPPGWPDPLESPQAEAIRNGKMDDTELRNLFDCMERELRLHRERAVNPAKVTDAMVEAARKIMWGRDLNHLHGDDLIRAALTAAIGAGGQAVAWWHVGKWGNGTSCADESNIFCDAWETPIATNLPTEIAEAIVEAHNAALSQPHPADERVVEALREMEPHIRTIKNAVRINDEWGRVVDGQTAAATALAEIFDAALSAKEGRS